MTTDPLTPREELLVAGVNARLKQRKREARWWWLADWRGMAEGARWGFVWSAFPMGMYFWLRPSDASIIGHFFAVGVAWVVLAVSTGAHTAIQLRRQQEIIERLTERVKILEARGEA